MRRDSPHSRPWEAGGLLVLLLLLLLAGCGESQPPTLQELYNDERSLPAVYLVDGTGERMIAPGDQGVVVQDGKLAWPALTCMNPDCPEKTPGGNEPFLFIAPDPAVVAQPDGSVGYDRSRVDKADNYFGNCPQCLNIRNLAGESDKDRQRYSNWVRPYVLPQTVQRREELAAARKSREAALRARMTRTVD